jgi:hypothetical protein
MIQLHETQRLDLFLSAASAWSRAAIEKRWGGPSVGSVKMEEHGCEIAARFLEPSGRTGRSTSQITPQTR